MMDTGKDRSSIISKLRHVGDMYYILVVLAYTSTLMFFGMRPGVVATALMLFILAVLAAGHDLKVKTLQDVLAVVFFVYEILSVIWLLAGGFPLSVFTGEFISSVLPMVFYFVGKSAGRATGRWYRIYIAAMLILGILGIALYALAPQFYNDWLVALKYTSKADAATTRVRMNSVVGSTILSFNMVAGMMVSAWFMNTKRTDRSKHDMAFAVTGMTVCFLSAVLANQRSGLVAAALVIVYVNCLVFFVLDMIPRKYFWIELGTVAVLFIALCAVRFDYVLKFWYRIISLPTAVSERSEQWVAAVNNMYTTWLGNGLGANGHRAIGIEDAHVIADGGLVKLYCENGVIGFSIWIYLILLAVRNGAKRLSDHYTELGIVAVGILQSIGSNMLAFQFCAPVFWFAVGRMCTDHDGEAE
ncbi:MAG: hypothetical protein J5367_04755 [Lachnospiraceae bacterium]|nr:hypothetical protein [Lachnospiraceae bacterium]